MSVTVQLEPGNDVVHVRLSGKLTKADYEAFAPELERYVEQHGKLKLLVETDDFHGWDAAALWADIKFSVRHFDDVARLAIVGEKKWEQGMAMFCKPFTTASVRYFDKAELDEAKTWVADSAA